MSWYIYTLLILINHALLPATAYWNMAMHFHLANFYIMSIRAHSRALFTSVIQSNKIKQFYKLLGVDHRYNFKQFLN
jgi:hypothetical protein